MSQITTHILDTAKGKPAWGVAIELYRKEGADYVSIGKGITNKDGRLPNLLEDGPALPFGTYKITFDTAHYFSTMDVETLYPLVEIIFYVKTTEHYHIPLLVSPFGYSTYRGS